MDSTTALAEWKSAEGFSILVRPDGKYRFCDSGRCFEGVYERPGAADSLAVVLKDFHRHPETERFRQRLASVGAAHGAIEMTYPDLDFTVTGGIVPDKWCDGKPCVLFGSVSEPDHLIFRRTEDE